MTSSSACRKLKGMDTVSSPFWRSCSTCKKHINFGSRYYICSVSTCNGERTGYVFCSISCFDAHLPGARHRDAGAIEKIAPKDGNAPSRTLIKPTSPVASREVLIVASRLKEYIQSMSEFNTSAAVMDVLSDHVRIVCDRAIENARAEGRKTVLDRDFDFLKKS